MAVSMNQRMVSSGRSGSVTFWAWTASVAVHLIILTVFGVVKFSHSKAQGKRRAAPTADVSRIRKLAQTTATIPKPKIKKTAQGRFTKKPPGLLLTNQTPGALKPTSQNLGDLAKPVYSQSIFSMPSGANSPHRIEFFGSFAKRRKVCYVVDCSGSMKGVFGRVRKKLKESIAILQPDQYFYIIFFGGDKLFEFGNSRLLRATEKAKSTAYDFIDSIRPAGQTNALTALERAVQIRDNSGFSPAVIYFLTDGFELTTEGAQRFARKIANLQKRFAPTTRINTIGFWPQSSDRKMLEVIARQSGGEFVFIADDDT